MIEVIVAGLYCLVAMYACFRVGQDIRVRKSEITAGKVGRAILIGLMLFGMIVSGVLFTEVILHVIAPGTVNLL